MYKDFFCLKEYPFDLTPDSHFLFPSKKHQEALAHLTYGIEAKKGFILITGEVGAGKTTLCRALLSRTNENTEVAFVLNSYLNAFEILQAVNQDLGIKTKAQSKKELIDELNEFLLEQKRKNKNVVVLIDECQNLPFETLEQLRMLSNLETEKEKLLQIIMVGQPELLDILSTPELRQLNQRITIRYHLYPLNYKEMVEYIYHRLKVAGSDGSIVFTEKALRKIFNYSRGIPRIINVVCDNSLLAAYVVESKTVTHVFVKKAIKEIQGKKPLKDLNNKFFSWGFSFKRVLRYSFVGAVVLLLAGLFMFFKDMRNTVGLYSITLSNARKIFEDSISRLKEEKQKVEEIKKQPQTQVVVLPQDVVSKRHSAELIKKLENPSVKPVSGLLEAWGIDKDLRGAIEEKYRNEDKLDFDKIASEAGVSSVVSWVDINTLIKFNLPALLEVSDVKSIRKYVLLKHIKGDKAVVYDGGLSSYIVISELEKIFVGSAVLFVKGIINSDEVFYKTSSGKTVEEIQSALKSMGYYIGEIDGVYSDDVVEAVKKFQSKTGLSPDGISDINTRLALYGNLTDSKIPRLKVD